MAKEYPGFYQQNDLTLRRLVRDFGGGEVHGIRYRWLLKQNKGAAHINE